MKEKMVSNEINSSNDSQIAFNTQQQIPDSMQLQGAQVGYNPNYNPNMQQQGDNNPNYNPNMQQQGGYNPNYNPNMQQQGGNNPNYNPNMQQQGGYSNYNHNMPNQNTYQINSEMIAYFEKESYLTALSRSDYAFVKQKVELLEALTGCETENRYQIFIRNPDGSHYYLFKAKESSDCCERQCCA
jgi:hypothetical protein